MGQTKITAVRVDISRGCGAWRGDEAGAGVRMHLVDYAARRGGHIVARPSPSLSPSPSPSPSRTSWSPARAPRRAGGICNKSWSFSGSDARCRLPPQSSGPSVVSVADLLLKQAGQAVLVSNPPSPFPFVTALPLVFATCCADKLMGRDPLICDEF